MKKIPKNPLILVRISGGLGNQMFQYAAALALGKHWRCPVKVDIRHYDKKKDRTYQLDQYKSSPVIARAKDIAPFDGIAASFRRRLHYFIPQYHPTHTRYIQPDLRFDPDLLKLRPPIFLRRGYFQSEKFFLSYTQTIRDAFQLKHPLPTHSENLRQEIKASLWPVALHVRRGDYVNYEQKHYLCPRAYYEKAVNIINEFSGQKAAYFIFSDDIPEARSLLSFIPGATFVTANENEPWVDMNLMAACRDVITANSSFSWWGAWLNSHPEKHIITPYFRGQTNNADAIPPEWISLSF